MPSYFITGVSRGIGHQFLDTLSSDPNNIVIGLVRNVPDTKAKIASWNRSNIHLVPGDLTDYASLEKAASLTADITGGSLDHLIACAAYLQYERVYEPFSERGTDPKQFEKDMMDNFNINVIAQAHLINLFMPLVLKSEIKKVIAITSGMGDAEMAVKLDLYEAGPYAVSKTALNMVVAKFQAEYNKNGVLFLAICPGAVETGQYAQISEEEGAKLAIQGAKFQAYAPDWKGPITPEESVNAVLKVVDNSSFEKGDGGKYLSHKGNKQWL